MDEFIICLYNIVLLQFDFFDFLRELTKYPKNGKSCASFGIKLSHRIKISKYDILFRFIGH